MTTPQGRNPHDDPLLPHAEAALAARTPQSQLPHYSPNPEDAVYFYGGPFSNFVGGPFEITAPHLWLPAPHRYTASYLTIEHFFQASKAETLSSHEFVRQAEGPWEAKAAGRSVPMREDWDAPHADYDGNPVKYGYMLIGLRVKFAQPEFRDQLLATGNRQIAEDSPTDDIWGIRDKRGGLTGQNLLGRALMQVRRELRVASGAEEE